MRAVLALVLAACVVGTALAAVRWLRVVQREHYLVGAAARFAVRWLRADRRNLVIAVVGLLGAVAGVAQGSAALVPAVAASVAPLGLTLRGSTSPLKWTRRLVTLAVTAALLDALLISLGGLLGGLAGAVGAAGLVALGVPLSLDAALAVLGPIENAAALRHVGRARAALGRVQPLVVGITGSFGKTSTKNYVAHLAAGSRRVLASPRSFNNRAGLARTVNEQLEEGIEVLVAEMGAYGPGEIAALCGWLHPEISVITAIGPAHLERFGSLDRTLSAKAEIAAEARVLVVNCDDELLARLAFEREHVQRVVRASGVDPGADVAVIGCADSAGDLEIWLGGREVGTVLPRGHRGAIVGSNLACAVAVAVELGVTEHEILERLPDLPEIPNRLQRYAAESGYLVLDDTFNANPAGARLALASLARSSGDAGSTITGRRVVVTPGIVELGRLQPAENDAWGEAVAQVATDIVVVGRTNRDALVAGWRRAMTRPDQQLHVFASRRDAVTWARATLGPGDAVLFENDLPDHFP